MATEKNLNNLIINKVENQAVYDYMKTNNLINTDELYFISGADDNATETESGLMSAEDKLKLDGIEDGANKTIIDTALSSTSTNPVQNKVINTKFNTIQSNIDNKVPTSRTVNGKALTGNITLSASDVGALPSNTVIPSIDGLATETYVNNKVAGLVDSAPSTLDTLNELAAALGDDPNFATTIATQIGGKVDKVNGKGLSTNDYTTAEKQKLANIANGANNYTLPVATSSILGGIKSGTDITIDASGNVSVNDDSHNHIISNVDGLQSALDNKIPSSRTVNGKALSSNISLVASDVGAIPTTDGAVGASNLAANAVTNAKIVDGAVTNGKLASDSIGTQKLIDGAVSASKISYGALVAIKEFSVENSEWIENSYGTYNKTVTIDGIDPTKHIGFLMLRRSVKIPDVDTAWEFSNSMLDTDDEKMSCIFGCKITAVNELTITAKEKPIGTIYLTLMVVHI